MNEWFGHLWQFLSDACTREGFARRVLRMPELASKNGREVDDLMVYVHWLMLALFVGWSLYFVYVLWRFSAAQSQGRF